MNRQYLGQKKTNIVIYALIITFVLAACFVGLKDIKISTEHVSQNIEVTLNK